MSTKRKVSTPSAPASAGPQHAATDKESHVARWAQAWSDQFRREMATAAPVENTKPTLQQPRRRVKAAAL